MANEQPTPLHHQQQEVIFQQLSPRLNFYAKELFPADKVLFHGDILQQKSVNKLVKEFGGEAYHLTFGVISTSKNFAQLSNAISVLQAIPLAEEDTSIDIKKVQNDFLKTAHSPKTPMSEWVSSLREKIFDVWDKNHSYGERDVVDRLQLIFDNINCNENTPHWFEAYIRTVMDADAPLELRNLLLKNAISLTSTDLKFVHNSSVLTAMDGSWFYPEVFAQKKETQVKQKLQSFFVRKDDTKPEEPNMALQDKVGDLTEQVKILTSDLADARRIISQLSAELTTSREDAGTVRILLNETKERQEKMKNKVSVLESQLRMMEGEASRLKAENLNLKLKNAGIGSEEKIRFLEARVVMLKGIGGFPLDILNIPLNDWALKSPEERKQVIKRAYLALAQKHHPDRYMSNPELFELKGILFNQATNAKEYLEAHIEQNEF